MSCYGSRINKTPDLYLNPELIFKGPVGGRRRTVLGWVTDIVIDTCLSYLENHDRSRRFCLLYHHTAPHREWEPDEQHISTYANEVTPEPDTLHDDYANRGRAAKAAAMRVVSGSSVRARPAHAPRPTLLGPRSSAHGRSEAAMPA
jgi:hypothetical protein